MDYEEALRELASPTNVKFSTLLRICIALFGEPRKRGSHHVFRVPWEGDPRVNLQKDGSKAKPYQVKQVVQAINKLKSTHVKASKHKRGS